MEGKGEGKRGRKWRGGEKSWYVDQVSRSAGRFHFPVGNSVGRSEMKRQVAKMSGLKERKIWLLGEGTRWVWGHGRRSKIV